MAAQRKHSLISKHERSGEIHLLSLHTLNSATKTIGVSTSIVVIVVVEFGES